MRSEVREQLNGSVPDAEFDAQIPSWDNLPPETRWAKILIARDELLMVLDRAGYQVNKKRETS
jgi:hypothetical protein